MSTKEAKTTTKDTLDKIPEEYEGDWNLFTQDTWGPAVGLQLAKIELDLKDCEALHKLCTLSDEDLDKDGTVIKRVKQLTKSLDAFITTKFQGLPVRVVIGNGINDAVSHKVMDRTANIIKPILEKNAEDFKNDVYDQNDDLRACVFGWRRALRCKNGSQIVELIQYSDNVQSYLARVVEKKLEKVVLAMQPADDVNPCEIFRGYVYKGKLNAISQYFHRIYFEEHTVEFLTDIRERTKKLWVSYHEKLAKIGLESYLFDYALVDNKVHVLSMHPFVKSMHPLLLKWKADAKQLQKGPCQIWFREEPINAPRTTLSAAWRSWVCRYHGIRDPTAPVKKDKHEDSGVYGYFRYIAMIMVVLMTAASVYMYLTAPQSSGSGNFRRRRGRRG